MAFQKKTKQDEQNLLFLSIESREVRENDPLAPYRKHVDQFDLSEEQKLELITSLWVILENYFDQQLGLNQLETKRKKLQNSVDVQLHGAILEHKGNAKQQPEGTQGWTR